MGVSESTDYEQRLTQIERGIEEGLNQNDTSVPKLRAKIEHLEQQLARARQSLVHASEIAIMCGGAESFEDFPSLSGTQPAKISPNARRLVVLVSERGIISWCGHIRTT